MTPSGFLSREDVRLLTGAVHASRQEAWLKAEGIPAKRRDSDLIVMWVHVQAWIEGAPIRGNTGPNWDALKQMNERSKSKTVRPQHENK